MLDGTTSRPFFPRRPGTGAIISHIGDEEEERDLDGMAINVDLEYQADNEEEEEDEEDEEATVDDEADDEALRLARAQQAAEEGGAVDAVQLNSVKREMTFLYFQNTLWKKITGGEVYHITFSVPDM